MLVRVAGITLLAALAGCGGGDVKPQGPLAHAQSVALRSGAHAVAAPADVAALAAPLPRKSAQATATAAAGAAVADAPTQLFNFGERNFPQYFSGPQANQTAGTLVYRYYPAAGTFLIVSNTAQVYVLGGPFGNQVVYVGLLGDFLLPLGGSVSGLSAPGLVLANQGEALSVGAGASSFRFGNLLPAGAAYSITVQTQPTGLSCSVFAGSGLASSASAPSVNCAPSGSALAPRGPIALKDAALEYNIDAVGIGGGEDGGGGAGDGDGGAAGSAGDGAPFARARVTLTDVSGRSVNGLTDDRGRFLLRLNTALFNPPYVLRVVDASGHVRTSVITERIGSGTAVWSNINPLTDKIVSDSLNPGVGGTDKAFDGSQLDLTRVSRANADVVNSVRTALTTAGVADSSRFDPIRSLYPYDGNGVDAVIDSLNHTRDPGTGATQLRTRLATVATNSLGTEVPQLVTATSPLASSLVALPNSDALTYAKLQSWVSEFNRCLALSATAFAADAACVDADGTRLVRSDFKSNGRDFRESLRTLFSEFDGSPVAGSSVRNPTILFVERSAGSGADDLAIVRLTVQQPYVGPKGPDGPVGGAVEYPVVTVFKRDNTLARAPAGNWILYGNQLDYDFAIEPRYYRFTQGNPARQDSFPSYVHSSLRMLAARKRYDRASKTFVDANIRAVRVRGPGLPPGGMVLAPSSACGTSSYLAVLNKTGTVPTGDTLASIVQNDFRLASVALDGRRFATPGSYFPARDIAVNAIPYVTDFSPIRAYSRYSFEVFLRSNPGNTTPDRVETARLLAPLMAPEFVLNLPMNDVTPSLPLVAFGGAAIPANAAAAINWTNNLFAAPVGAASLYAEEANPSRPTDPIKFYNIRTPVAGAYGVRSVPSSQLLVVPSASADPNCPAGRIPPYDGATGVYREVTLTSLQGQARVYSSMGWNR